RRQYALISARPSRQTWQLLCHQLPFTRTDGHWMVCAHHVATAAQHSVSRMAACLWAEPAGAESDFAAGSFLLHALACCDPAGTGRSHHCRATSSAEQYVMQAAVHLSSTS